MTMRVRACFSAAISAVWGQSDARSGRAVWPEALSSTCCAAVWMATNESRHSREPHAALVGGSNSGTRPAATCSTIAHSNQEADHAMNSRISFADECRAKSGLYTARGAPLGPGSAKHANSLCGSFICLLCAAIFKGAGQHSQQCKLQTKIRKGQTFFFFGSQMTATDTLTCTAKRLLACYAGG